MKYAYIRVSTKEQNTSRQLDALKEYDIDIKNIYIDKQSGKDFNRPNYKKLIRRLKKDDVLYIHSIDRLGRNYNETTEQWRFLIKEKSIQIIVLDMPILSNKNDNDITSILIADIVLQLLSYVAQKERELIRQRQAEGIASAKARGVKFGRKPKQRTYEFYKLKQDYLNSKISSRSAGAILNISHSTFLSWINEKNGQ